MKKLIKLSLIAVFLGIHPMACIQDDPYGCGDTSKWAKIVEIQSLYSDIVKSSEMWDHRFLEDTAAYIHSEEIGFIIGINQTLKIAQNSPKFNFGNYALACSPIVPEVSNPIKRVEIIYKGLSQNFSDSIFLNTGDTITAFFRYVSPNYYEPTPLPLNDIIFDNPRSSDLLLIKLVEPNPTKIEIPFTAVIHLMDDKRFEFEKLKFKLLPSTK